MRVERFGGRGAHGAAGLRSTSCQQRLCLYRAVWSARQAKLAHLHPGSLFPFWRWKINCCATNDFGWRTGHRAPLQPLTATGGGEGNVQVGDGRAERYDKSMVQTNWAQRAKIENKEIGWKSKTSSIRHGKRMGTEEIYSQWCRTGDGRLRRLPGVVPRAGTITGNMDRFAPSLE